MPSTGRIETELDRLYANRFPEAERAAKARLWRTLCDAFFSRYVPADGTVLDIGAGYCEFINNVRAARRIAVDLNPDTAKAAAEEVEVSPLPLERLGEVVAPESVDLAFASNVFEHLRGPDVLLEVLAAMLPDTAAGRAADHHAAQRPRRRRRVLGLRRPHAAADREGDDRGAGDCRASRSSSGARGSCPTRPRAACRSGPVLVRLYLALAPGPVVAGQADVRGRAETRLMSGNASVTTAVDFVMPVYNEGSNICRALAEIYATRARCPSGCLIVYDFDEDNTLPVRPRAGPPVPRGRAGAGTPWDGACQRHPGRHRGDAGRGGYHHHGRPVRRPERGAPDGGADPRSGLRHRLRLALHEGGPSDRRALGSRA